MKIKQLLCPKLKTMYGICKQDEPLEFFITSLGVTLLGR